MNSSKLKGHLAMLSANTCWGLMSPVAKLVMSAGVVTPLLMTHFRVMGAALLFWLLSAFTKRERVGRRDLLKLVGAAVLGILVNQGSFIFGVGFSSPGEASIITTTMPMWVMVLAFFLLHEPITLKKAGGIVLGAAGALILVLSNTSHTTARGANPMLGDALVLLAQLSYALYLTLFRNFIRRYSLVTLMKWMFTFATLLLSPFSLSSLLSAEWSQISWTQWGGVGYVVLFGTFVGYICIMVGQKTLRPTLVGMYNYVQPIVASLVGVCLGLDRFTPVKVLAVVLIFSGVYLVAISKAAKAS